ncbi:MAG: hypothetical protein ACI32E_00915 [Bacilli bacterium]
MKSSVFPFIAGGMTVLGVWLAYANRSALDKLVKSIGDTTEQTIEKFKAKMDAMTCQNNDCCCNNPE